MIRTISLGFVAVAAACGGTAPVSGNGSQGSWEVRADIPYRVQEIYPALHRGRIYLAGGLSPDVRGGGIGVSDRLYIYDPSTDQWSEGPSLPEPRHHPYLVSTGEELFALGGFVAREGDIWHASTGILLLDEDAGEWKKVADLQHPQSETVAAFIDGRIYLAGGRMPTGSRNSAWSDQGDIDRVQVFDPMTRTVTAGPSAPTARNSAAGAVIDGKLYIAGGRTVSGGNQSTTEVFDPATGRWETLSPMPLGQGGNAAAAVDGKLYVFGGEFFGSNGSGVFKEAWVYDPAVDSWVPVEPMPVPRHGLGAVAIGSEIYVIGGATQPSGQGTSSRLSVFRP